MFEGELSLDSGGGFASVRCAPAPLGLAGATACLLEVRGDGQRYKLNLLVDDRFDSINHQAGFVAEPGAWQTLRIPLADFQPTFRGRQVAGAPPLDPAHIRQVGLMIADRQAGTFALGVRWIALG